MYPSDVAPGVVHALTYLLPCEAVNVSVAQDLALSLISHLIEAHVDVRLDSDALLVLIE